MPEADNLVEVKSLRFLRSDKIIFNNVDINIPKGKVTAIMGPSGCGKTTLLRLIGGQLKPKNGVVDLDGHIINKLSRSKLYKIRRRMGMLFQTGALFTNMSVFENVAFPLREHTKLSNEMIRHLVLMKLQAVGLRGSRDLMPNELSGGMARRVALARAIIFDPELIMYDEPFTGLDPVSMGVTVKLIRELNNALGLTTIIVSHDVAEVMTIADYIYILSNGNVCAQGTPDEIKNNNSEEVQQFMNGLPDGPVPFHVQANQSYVEDMMR